MSPVSNGGKKPRLLDLFCGAGGAAMGYHRAGFEVVGVDIKPQPNYPFEFHQADALSVLGSMVNGTSVLRVDAIHASPPCQAYTLHNHARDDHPDLLPDTRELLRLTELPYVIENVPGAPIDTVIRLCGSSFGLGVYAYDGWRQLRRHRYFETTFPMLSPPCQHTGNTVGLYGDHLRDRRRKGPNGKGLDFPDKDRVPLGGAAMGIDWMEWDELREAIPPVYTELIGSELMRQISSTGTRVASCQ